MKHRTYDDRNDVADAIEAYLSHGFAVIEGTKTPAIRYANRMTDILKVRHGSTPIIGYASVPTNGYYYFVYDPEVFINSNDPRLLSRIRKIDADST